jgi:hypothetical protein
MGCAGSGVDIGKASRGTVTNGAKGIAGVTGVAVGAPWPGPKSVSNMAASRCQARLNLRVAAAAQRPKGDGRSTSLDWLIHQGIDQTPEGIAAMTARIRPFRDADMRCGIA